MTGPAATFPSDVAGSGARVGREPVGFHLFTTDPSAIRICAALPEGYRVSCVIVPGNRAASAKVAALRAVFADVPIVEHKVRQRLDPDLPPAAGAISWLYSQIIRPEDLGRYPLGTLNMHGGRIPDFRGANVLQWAIVAGQDRLGVTWHGLVEEVDAGPIWTEGSVPIEPEDTALTLRDKMIEGGLALFPDAFSAMLDGRVMRLPDLSGGCVWPSRRPADGLIRPGMTARQVRDLVRALCPPWPPAFVEAAQGPIAIARVSDCPVAGTLSYDCTDGVRLHLVPAEGGRG